MAKTLAYLRTSTDKQDTDNQRLEILEYARQHDMQVDDFIEIVISSRKSQKQRRVDELVEKLETGDTLIVTELSRIGRSTAEVITVINDLMDKKVRVIIIKQNLDMIDNNMKSKMNMQSKMNITLFSLFGELERDLISLRTKEALAAKKAQGQILGKPKGTIQKSKFDKDLKRIKDLLGVGLSVRKIANVLGYTSHIGLNTYINKRNIRNQVKMTKSLKSD